MGERGGCLMLADYLPRSSQVKINHRIAHHEKVESVERHLKSILIPFAVTHNFSFAHPDGVEPILIDDNITSWASAVGALELQGSEKLEPAPISPTSGRVWETLTGTIRQVFSSGFVKIDNNNNSTNDGASHDEKRFFFPDPQSSVIITPTIMLGNTDTKHYWNLTRHIYRFSPSRGEGFGRDLGRFGVHTVDERQWIESVVEGVVFYYQLIRNFNEM